MSEPDKSLIAEFNASRSEAAFAALVRQRVNLVFATALRQVGDYGGEADANGGLWHVSRRIA